ncbi:hypothetical protein EV424DRAFT_1549280 [Suillus variegatus]|nr:hypothetical protein EV424DRAFT_1549280 [Suillus variegatus]
MNQSTATPPESQARRGDRHSHMDKTYCADSFPPNRHPHKDDWSMPLRPKLSTITGPSNIPAVLNTDITIPSLTQDFPRDNSPSPTDSTFTQTPPTTPSSSSSSISSARSSDVLWDQLEDLSEYMNAVSLG